VLHPALIAHVGKLPPAPLVADTAKGVVQGDAARVADDTRAWRVARVEIGETAQVEEQAISTPQRQPQTNPGSEKRPDGRIIHGGQ